MPSILQTWTTERVEALKIHFEAGLSCREIAAEIGVSRNAVIGKISRLSLVRDNGGVIRTAKKEPASSPRPRGAQRLRQILLKSFPSEPEPECERCADPQRPHLLAVRAFQGNLPLADLDAGARGFLLLRQHRRSRACPIALATAGWRIG